MDQKPLWAQKGWGLIIPAIFSNDHYTMTIGLTDYIATA